MSKQQSLEQLRAAAAWAGVGTVKKETFKDKYGALARSAPADIQCSGLGQILAFWRAKKDKKEADEYVCIYNDVSRWVGGQLKLGDKDLLEWITQTASTSQYRRATAEAIAFAIWLKRFAEAELGGQ